MKKSVISFLVFSVIIAVSATFAWQWWQQQQSILAKDFVSGNGRIEADKVDITTKYSGRVKHILVQEGDLVKPNQILAKMDTTELDAQLTQTQAQVAQAQAAVAEGAALIAQRKSELTLAELELKRVAPLVKTGAMSQSIADQTKTVRDTAFAAYTAAKAHVHTLEQSVLVAKSAVTRVQTQIDEATLKSPVMGRVLYRLAQPNEVLGGGGKVLTIINLGEIYMEMFLPSAQAYLTPIGAQARIKLDIIDTAIPAQVSFVSPESQFTPKQVETQSERDKLMFRVKVRIPQALVLKHIEQVKTGARGVAYIRLSPEKGEKPSPWPDFLQKLPDNINPAEQSNQQRTPKVNETRQTVASITGVTHSYNNTLALDNINLSIPAGLMVGLLGPDGVGKSTLMGLISGARKLQQGQLTVLNGDMTSAKNREMIGPRIAYMPQGLGKNLYSELSVEENLDFFGKLFNQSTAERKLRIDKLTKATELHAFLSRPAKKLSGGMKQKLGLCCALIHDPDLLILDEPTTGVDPLSRQQFWQLIASIRAERPTMSVLVSTAYMDEAEGFDYLIAMDAGHVLDIGTPLELKTKTNAQNLESAFVSLLPENKRANHNELIIPPYQKTQDSPAITAKHLSRRFGDFTAVNDVSFEIQVGEIFGFLGSNGCGKTTTMKMLTGLLPASSGDAYLFGKPIDANDLETRQRVGFMSQAFSLYGELTVSQNLTLHARLFHLSPEQAASRIDQLVNRFGLLNYMDEPAASLPLGMRQRLSLAVAVIHEPEMLILDEPTSGVDPIARDLFWELLVELSRKDKVTIFVSTHFMNEALRCDRISLMHAGEVLIYGTPQQLIKTKSVNTLEQAFIEYLEDAIQRKKQKEHTQQASQSNNQVDITPSIAQPITIENVPSKKDTVKHNRFSFHRLLAYSYLESMQVLRDPIRLAFAFIGSAILLIVIAYGISLDVENLNYAAFDNDRTPESRQYLSNFEGSRYFVSRPNVQSNEELERRLRSNDITLAIEIPAGFGRDLKNGKTPSISAWIDGSNTIRSGTIEGYVTGVHLSYIAELAKNVGLDMSALANVKLESRYRYNPTFKTVYSIGPKTPAMLLLLFPAILMAVSISREKEIGTITNFFVTPTKKLEFLMGKQLPYIAIGMLNFFILTIMVVYLLQVPLKGSFLGLMLGALCYIIAATGFGLLIASVTKSQVASIFATAILCMLPTLQFSGIVQPTSTLEGSGHIIGTLWPATYYMHLSVAAFTKGLGFFDLANDIIVLALFGPIFIAIAAFFLKKQERQTMKTWINIFWLGIKELRSLLSDVIMLMLIVYSFSLAIYAESTAISESVHNASIAIVDEDNSALSGAIANALYPPYFKTPTLISAAEIDQGMDQDTFMFVVTIPPKFEQNIRQGRQPTVQIDIDATAVTQASIGNSYIQSIITKEVNHFANRSDATTAYPVQLIQRRAFNPNGTGMWFSAINALLNQITMLTIILTGAALLREREHGTIEHLLVMPLNAFQIVIAKIWSNGLIILVAFALSMLVMVEQTLDIPIAGSKLLLLLGTASYLFAAAAIGIFLGTIAQTMAQFALLVLMVIIPMVMLSGGLTPIESQPDIIQPITWLLPSRHFMDFSQAVVFRGAGFDLVWPQLSIIIALGTVFFIASLAMFRRSLERMT